MNQMTVVHCVVSRADWPEWVRINPDIPPGRNYDAFLEDLAQAYQGAIEDGGRAVKVDVKPAEFLAWCRKTGRNVKASSRAAYAAFRLIELQKKCSGH